MIQLDLDDLRGWFGFGVAGNFAGHLEQAGEAVDFTRVAAEADAPKGIFPWYAPGHDSFLGVFPLSHDALIVPNVSADDGPLNLQIEPEVGVACEAVWEGDAVVALKPFAFAAFNDCSIRRPGAPKISVKKNWGPASKGVARDFFEASDLTSAAATLRLSCHLRTPDGADEAYGVDSPLLGYSYFGDVLLEWIVERLANQKDSANTPLEDVGALMVACGRPRNVLIGIGSTRYTALGESTYLKPGDEASVRVYDTAGAQVSQLRQLVSGP